MYMATLIATILVVVSIVAVPASAQIPMGCTASMITSVSPCLGYLTGSGGSGSSPTADCCKAFGALISSSSDCSCLILTGNVPFSLPINRTLAVSLPSLCRSTSVPLFQCKGSSTTPPSPGSIPFGGALPPLPPFGPVSTTSPPPAVQPPLAVIPASPPPGSDVRPALLPSGAAKVKVSDVSVMTSLLLLVVLPMLLLDRF